MIAKGSRVRLIRSLLTWVEVGATGKVIDIYIEDGTTHVMVKFDEGPIQTCYVEHLEVEQDES